AKPVAGGAKLREHREDLLAHRLHHPAHALLARVEALAGRAIRGHDLVAVEQHVEVLDLPPSTTKIASPSTRCPAQASTSGSPNSSSARQSATSTRCNRLTRRSRSFSRAPALIVTGASLPQAPTVSLP